MLGARNSLLDEEEHEAGGNKAHGKDDADGDHDVNDAGPPVMITNTL